MLTDQLIRKRLHASTLVEVLAALVIFTLVTAVAATLYAKIVLKRPDNERNLLLELKDFAEQTKRECDLESARFEVGEGIQVSRTVSNYQGDTLLLLLELRARKPGAAEETVYQEIIVNGQ